MAQCNVESVIGDQGNEERPLDTVQVISQPTLERRQDRPTENRHHKARGNLALVDSGAFEREAEGI